jgi:hypothetical protein
MCMQGLLRQTVHSRWAVIHITRKTKQQLRAFAIENITKIDLLGIAKILIF